MFIFKVIEVVRGKIEKEKKERGREEKRGKIGKPIEGDTKTQKLRLSPTSPFLSPSLSLYFIYMHTQACTHMHTQPDL